MSKHPHSARTESLLTLKFRTIKTFNINNNNNNNDNDNDNDNEKGLGGFLISIALLSYVQGALQSYKQPHS